MARKNCSRTAVGINFRYRRSSREFNMAENATAEGYISTNEESQTDNSVMYRDNAYISSFIESDTWGGNNNNRCDKKLILVGGWMCQFKLFNTVHSISSICFGPNCPRLKLANVVNLIFRTSWTLMAIWSVVNDDSRAVLPLHLLFRVAKYRSKRDMLTATTSRDKSK